MDIRNVLPCRFLRMLFFLVELFCQIVCVLKRRFIYHSIIELDMWEHNFTNFIWD